MKQINDKIQFESKWELRDLIKMIEKYIDAHPEAKENSTIMNFYKTLDLMMMIW